MTEAPTRASPTATVPLSVCAFADGLLALDDEPLPPPPPHAANAPSSDTDSANRAPPNLEIVFNFCPLSFCCFKTQTSAQSAPTPINNGDIGDDLRASWGRFEGALRRNGDSQLRQHVRDVGQAPLDVLVVLAGSPRVVSEINGLPGFADFGGIGRPAPARALRCSRYAEATKIVMPFPR